MQILYIRMEGNNLLDHAPYQRHRLAVTRTNWAGIRLDFPQTAPLLVLQNELHVTYRLHQRYNREAGVGSWNSPQSPNPGRSPKKNTYPLLGGVLLLRWYRGLRWFGRCSRDLRAEAVLWSKETCLPILVKCRSPRFPWWTGKTRKDFQFIMNFIAIRSDKY